MVETEYLSRSKGALWFPYMKEIEVIVIGAGGTGSHAALALARLGCDLTLYDHDDYEIHNMTGQLTSKKSLGKNKAEALSELLEDFSPESSISVMGKYEEDSQVNPFIFLCPDNMKVRELAFNKWENNLNHFGPYKDKAVFVDLRLGWETFEIYVVKNNPEDIANYRLSLHKDGDLPDMECTLKQTHYCAGICSNLAVNLFKNHIANVYDVGYNQVPFYCRFDLLNFKLEYGNIT